MVGIRVSFWDRLFAGAMLVSGRVSCFFPGFWKKYIHETSSENRFFHGFAYLVPLFCDAMVKWATTNDTEIASVIWDDVHRSILVDFSPQTTHEQPSPRNTIQYKDGQETRFQPLHPATRMEPNNSSPEKNNFCWWILTTFDFSEVRVQNIKRIGESWCPQSYTLVSYRFLAH